MIRNWLHATALTAAIYTAVMPQGADAQVAADRTFAFAIPAGPLKDALDSWQRRTGIDLIYQEGEVASAQSPGVTGRMSAQSAFGVLIEGTGFQPVFTKKGGIALVRSAVEGNATPDILVEGKRTWSLNTGIARNRDDSQPFIVMTQEDIKKSGAPDIETFLRNMLSVNASPSLSEQRGGTPGLRGLSSINLRGLGARETLILVDGRRQPGVNIGNGELNQPQITGIPIASIERIEVLASSASGIYGSGATGGVINIILRRNYQGGELALNYADTSDFAKGDARIDLTAAKTLEGGRTNISLSASWRKSLPLLYGSRRSMFEAARDESLENQPGLFEFAGTPRGTTPNFRSINGSVLQLKPAYGGTTLATRIGHVPEGYRGLATDGIAPLLANVGTYNFDYPDTAVIGGSRYPLLFGARSINGTLGVRREFNPWLTGYLEVSGARTRSISSVSLAPIAVDLSANAPNNPFVQAIRVVLPASDAEFQTTTRLGSLRGVAGAIVKLPYGWQGVADFSWARNRFQTDTIPPFVSPQFEASLVSGGNDVLRDLEAYPLAYQFINRSFGFKRTPGVSTTTTGALKFAGPLPLSLPGGVSQMTLNFERTREQSAPTTTASNGRLALVTYSPQRSQTITSVYGEVAFPIISEANHLPFVRLLELRLSARHERYVGTGASMAVLCQFSLTGVVSEDIFTDCPPAGTDLGIATARNSHTDPSISGRWAPTQDIMFRASYTTGYLPPSLAQLTQQSGLIDIIATDPLRGGEAIAATLPGKFGGNTTVKPESSKSVSVGVILTPRFLPGLRFSADLTHIRKRDNYFDPGQLLYAFTPEQQTALEIYLRQYPDRVTRGPASGGFTVGPITAIDVSLANLVGSTTEAVDFALDYSHGLLGGTLDLASTASWTRKLAIETFPGVAPVDYAGVVSNSFSLGFGNNGAVKWRGTASVRWSRDRLTLGWQGRYTGPYFLLPDHSVVASQGSATVASQFYQDLSASYRFEHGMTVRAGVNNFLGRKPPRDVSGFFLFYSQFGDYRNTNFFLNVAKSF